MPNRALIAAATIVWALGVLVALIFGLPTLLTIEGVNVDIGLIVNALVAAGTFSAAAAAVWIATSDVYASKNETPKTRPRPNWWLFRRSAKRIL